MALLSNLFDILRGWPNGGAIEESWPVYAPGGTPVVLPPGTVVYVRSDGTVDKASTPNAASADGTPTWVVIASNQDLDGQFLTKVVCLRRDAVFRLDPSNIAAGSYAVGSLVSFATGQWTLAAANDQVIGEVLLDNRTVDGTMNVLYTGGVAPKK